MAFTPLLVVAINFCRSEVGNELTMRYDGFVSEETIVPDYWEFNSDDLVGKAICDNGRQLFRGDSWLSAERVPA